MQRTITVSAEGRVSARPDLVRITSGVVTEAETAQAALADNNTLMTAVISNLKVNGVADADVQTSTFSVSPKYEHKRDGSVPIVRGYTASNQVHAVIRDLTKIGEILDVLVKGGAIQIGGISFDFAEPDALKDKARKAAFENARHRAEIYAQAGGASLGEVLTIAEDAGYSARPSPGFARAAMAESVPIEAGEQTLEVKVTVTWLLK